MSQARLAEIHDLEDLARAAGTELELMRSYADTGDQFSHYVRLTIPKRGRKRHGQYRVVFKTRKEWLSQLHRSIAMIVVNSAAFQEHVQGFAKGRSIRTNAALHLGAKLLLHADVSNFFDSITTEQVKLALVSIGARTDVGDFISRACTINGFLRQGTRCSPAIANLVCRKLDMEMLSLADSYGATYSRYADDITFSGNDVPTDQAVRLVLEQNGFALRDGRCYVQRRGRSQFVTGLTIGDETQPRLPRRLKRRLRLVLHYVEKFGANEHFSRNVKNSVVASPSKLDGMLSFVHAIEPELAKKLWAKAAGTK
jgi:hypothetical protein